jgi:hypothetical protein
VSLTVLETEKLDACETAIIAGGELETDGGLETDALTSTVTDDAGGKVRLEVEEDVGEGVGVDELVPETVAVMLSETVLVTEPVPVALDVMDADDP